MALELARTGIGKFVLVDNDILEYHNLCRHQCSISEVGEYKVDALKRRILEINPSAEVEPIVSTVEMLDRPVFDTFCLKEQTVLIGCADNRSADVYANSISVMYGIPFLSIGFWERAFAGEIFYYLPRKNMPCYKCALGDGNLMSQRTSTNRRLYTNEEDLSKVNFEPGISVDINFVTTIGIKLLLDIFNLDNDEYTPRLLSTLTQYTLVCNTNNPNSFVEMIFKIIKSIPEKNITRSEESDYYNGIAGLLYIICDCYKKFNVDIDLYARNLIEYIVTDLFKRCDICGLWFQEEFYHQPLTGLAHGQSGYALALSKALPYINEGMRLKVTSQIQKCMDYEYKINAHLLCSISDSKMPVFREKMF